MPQRGEVNVTSPLEGSGKQCTEGLTMDISRWEEFDMSLFSLLFACLYFVFCLLE